MYLPASLATRDDTVRDVDDSLELIEYVDWETRTLPFGDVQVMLGTGMPPMEQVICPISCNKPFSATQFHTVGAPMGEKNTCKP